MEENKNISCDLCGKNKENRIWYLDKCICDECAEKISETVGIKKKNSPEIVDYIDKDPCDEIDEYFKEKNDSKTFGDHVLMAVASGIIGYYFTKKIYGIFVAENITFSFRIILLILFSLLPILAVYLLFCYRKNNQNSMDNEKETEKDRKKWKCNGCIKAEYYEKSKNTCDYCIRQSSFSFYSIYIGLIAFSFGMWVYIARFINIF